MNSDATMVASNSWLSRRTYRQTALCACWRIRDARSGNAQIVRGKLLWKNITSGTSNRRAARRVIHGTRKGLPTSIMSGRSCSTMRWIDRVASMKRYGRCVGSVAAQPVAPDAIASRDRVAGARDHEHLSQCRPVLYVSSLLQQVGLDPATCLAKPLRDVEDAELSEGPNVGRQLDVSEIEQSRRARRRKESLFNRGRSNHDIKKSIDSIQPGCAEPQTSPRALVSSLFGSERTTCSRVDGDWGPLQRDGLVPILVPHSPTFSDRVMLVHDASS